MAGQHGGKRPGAGRKRTTTGPAPDVPIDQAPVTDRDPLSYLLAVAAGTMPADAVRVAAARAALPYVSVRQRARLPAPPAKELAKRDVARADKNVAEAWELTAAAIIAKHKAKRGEA